MLGSGDIAACSGKQQYSRIVANKVARKTATANLTTFNCTVCGHWHVGVRRSPK